MNLWVEAFEFGSGVSRRALPFRATSTIAVVRAHAVPLWTRAARLGVGAGRRAICSRARRWASTRRRWKPTRRCGASCAGTRARDYEEFLRSWPRRRGSRRPTREDLAKLDRKRQKKGSNEDWQNPNDPDAKITKMKDGRTHLAHKAEHAVDLETRGRSWP